MQGKLVEAEAVRLNITSSLAVPLINSFAVFRSHPDLTEEDIESVAGKDGEFLLSESFMKVKETDGKMSVKVTLNGGSDKELSVYVATVPGTGVQGKVYQDKTATLTFPTGVTEQEFVVDIINNQNNEGDKDFYIQLLNPQGGDVTIGKTSTTRVLVEDDEISVN